jgi:hypothetical protein
MSETNFDPMIWALDLETAQRNDCHSSLAIDAERKVGNPKTGAGVAGHLPMAPQAGGRVTATRKLGHERHATRQANLPAVCVAAQIQPITRCIRVIGHLGRVNESIPTFVFVFTERRQRGLGIKAMNVVQSRDSQALVVVQE